MIDILTVLVSHGLLAYILFRAVVLDRTLPWFEPVERNRDRPVTKEGKGPGVAERKRQERPRVGSKRFQPRFRNNPPA